MLYFPKLRASHGQWDLLSKTAQIKVNYINDHDNDYDNRQS